MLARPACLTGVSGMFGLPNWFGIEARPACFACIVAKRKESMSGSPSSSVSVEVVMIGISGHPEAVDGPTPGVTMGMGMSFAGDGSRRRRSGASAGPCSA